MKFIYHHHRPDGFFVEWITEIVGTKKIGLFIQIFHRGFMFVSKKEFNK